MTRHDRSRTPLLIGLCLICALAIVARFPRWIRGPDEAYVVVAEDAWANRFGLANYDDELMAARTGAMSGGRNRNFLAPTPPSIAVVVLPLAWLPTDARPFIWLLLNAGAFLTTCWLLSRVLSWPLRRPWIALAGAAAVLVSDPLAENLGRGQVYLLLMLAAGGVLAATATGRRGGAAGLAICTAGKLWGATVWIVWIAARQWRLLATAAALTTAFLLTALYVAGVETWVHYFTVVLPAWLSTPKLTVTAYQTIPSLFAHLLRADPQWNPHAAANLPTLSVFLTLVAGGLLLAITIWRALNQAHRLAAVAAAMILAVLFSPLGEQYHYLLAVPAIAVVVEIDGLHRSIRTAVLMLALFLLFAPLPFKSPELAQLAAGIFAYPRVAAALLVWLLLVTPQSSERLGTPETQ